MANLSSHHPPALAHDHRRHEPQCRRVSLSHGLATCWLPTALYKRCTALTTIAREYVVAGGGDAPGGIYATHGTLSALALTRTAIARTPSTTRLAKSVAASPF